MTFHQCCTDAVDSVVSNSFQLQFQRTLSKFVQIALRELHVGFSLTLAQVVPHSCCHGTRPATQHDADLLVRCPSPFHRSYPALRGGFSDLTTGSTQTQDKRCIKCSTVIYLPVIVIFVLLRTVFPYAVAKVDRHTFCYPWIPSYGRNVPS